MLSGDLESFGVVQSHPQSESSGVGVVWSRPEMSSIVQNLSVIRNQSRPELEWSGDVRSRSESSSGVIRNQSRRSRSGTVEVEVQDEMPDPKNIAPAVSA